MELTFWGATEDVTGSMTFVHLPEGIIMVDCGLAQGSSEARYFNELPLPYKASDIKAVLLTHAHLDHSGYLPFLTKKGFAGPIYCTAPTAALTKIILQDSASLDDQQLYDEEDVAKTVHLLRPVEWNQTIGLQGGTFSFFPAGHILGASSIKLKANGKTVIFSGDLGRKKDPLIPEAQPCPKADAVVMESTYGGKNRSGDIEKELHSFLMKLSRESKIGIIASFAVARGQLLVTLINDFFTRHPEDKFRVVIDSPMMSKANQVYQRYAHLTKLPDVLFNSMEFVESIDFDRQWESLRRKSGPLLIISSSGMLTGGRIGRHLLNWSDDKNAVLFLPGYQGKGTPGRALLEGERTLKGPHDTIFQWQGEILNSEAFSSHADQSELLEWTESLEGGTKVFLLHGEESAKNEFKKKLEQKKLNVKIPFRAEAVKI